MADINVEKDIIDLVAKTIATYGQIDIAFNNAGTEGEFTPFVEQSNAVYDTIFNANVRGVFWSMKHEAKAMLVQGRGTIINNASMGGVIGFANAGLYIASKHAVLGLTKTASIEWFRQGVLVNSINPGLIDTPLQDRILAVGAGEEGFRCGFGARADGNVGGDGQGRRVPGLGRCVVRFRHRSAGRRRLYRCVIATHPCRSSAADQYRLPPRSRAGRNSTARNSSNTASSPIPKILNGIDSSQISGHNSSATRASGQHSTNRSNQRRALNIPPN